MSAWAGDSTWLCFNLESTAPMYSLKSRTNTEKSWQNLDFSLFIQDSTVLTYCENGDQNGNVELIGWGKSLDVGCHGDGVSERAEVEMTGYGTHNRNTILSVKSLSWEKSPRSGPYVKASPLLLTFQDARGVHIHSSMFCLIQPTCKYQCRKVWNMSKGELVSYYEWSI